MPLKSILRIYSVPTVSSSSATTFLAICILRPTSTTIQPTHILPSIYGVEYSTSMPLKSILRIHSVPPVHSLVAASFSPIRILPRTCRTISLQGGIQYLHAAEVYPADIFGPDRSFVGSDQFLTDLPATSTVHLAHTHLTIDLQVGIQYLHASAAHDAVIFSPDRSFVDDLHPTGHLDCQPSMYNIPPFDHLYTGGMRYLHACEVHPANIISPEFWFIVWYSCHCRSDPGASPPDRPVRSSHVSPLSPNGIHRCEGQHGPPRRLSTFLSRCGPSQCHCGAWDLPAFPTVKALWATDKDRQSYVDAFQNFDTGAQAPGDNSTIIRSPGIIVSTTGVIGTGYTCTHAFRAFLFEPDFLEGVKDQAFARIRRLGQENLKTFCYCYIVPNLQYEQRIFTRQGNRRQLKASSE